MLLKRVNASGQLHCVPASLKGMYVIRFTVTSPQTTEGDIVRDWGIIQTYAEEILRAVNTVVPDKQRVILSGTISSKHHIFFSIQ
jgi:histidine decarboxylase